MATSILRRGVKLAYDSQCSRLVSNTSSILHITDDDGVRKIVLSSNKTRNSLTLDMMDGLISGIKSNCDSSLRCIVLSSTGPVFSSGHNLKDLANKDETYYKDTFLKCADLMLSIVEAPVPVIAAVNGIAAAAGCQLVATCDIVVATDNSSFSTPGVNFGIFCSTPGIAISRCVGSKAAAKMLYTGDKISAEEALRIGLITEVCQENDLDKVVQKYTASIKYKSRCVVELGKKFFYQQREMDLRSAYRMGADVMSGNLVLSDGREGVLSFIEKRAPVWDHCAKKEKS